MENQWTARFNELVEDNDLEIIPILNKMDLPSAEPEVVSDQIVDLIGCSLDEIIPASAKTGLGIDKIINAIIQRIPSPEGDTKTPFRFAVFSMIVCH